MTGRKQKRVTLICEYELCQTPFTVSETEAKTRRFCHASCSCSMRAKKGKARISSDHFITIATLLKVSGPAVNGAYQILVERKDLPDAARITGAKDTAISKFVDRFREVDLFIRSSYLPNCRIKPMPMAGMPVFSPE